MSAASIHIASPEPIADAIESGRLHDALVNVAGLAGAALTCKDGSPGEARHTMGQEQTTGLPLSYRARTLGHVLYDGNGDAAPIATAARAIATFLEHAVDREMAVSDLAEEMIVSYEELNMLYALLPNIATRVHASDVGTALVDETKRTLRCRRVSLLVLDDSRKNLKVLASHGLPADLHNLTIPVCGSISERAIAGEDCLIVNDRSFRPDLMELSRGEYESDAFAVVRVPLQAQGEAVGVLTATERMDDSEFMARDQKLLEGLAAMGASALLNCRLHGAINRQMVSTIRALASVIDAKDQYTHAHSARVAQLAVATVRKVGITDAETCREVELAGLLHDIGKIGISDTLLSKAGRLTPPEFKIVQRHTEIGAGIVQNVEGLDRVAQAIRHHHERYDGLGYPGGLAGQAIPFTSRVIAVTDVFDCLTSDRPYRKAIGTEQALKELDKSKGTQLDPTIVQAFIDVIRHETTLGAGHGDRHDASPAPALLQRRNSAFTSESGV